MKRPLKDMRSHWEFGEASVTRKGLMCGMGYTDRELDRPLVAVVNSWNEYNPGHVHLKEIAERVKQGVREAGGLPIEVMTTAICDGMVLKDPIYIEIPSRNSICDQVELTVEGNFFDGMVLLSTCDSIVPGHLMAAARLDIPTIMVTGGYMPHGQFRGREIHHKDACDNVSKAANGSIDMDEFDGIVDNSFAVCGACCTMTTANSMCMVAEALGLALPGNASLSATSSALRKIAYNAGLRIIGLIEENVTARQLITEASIFNAIKMDMALAGSSNLLLHIPAIAHEAGYDMPCWKLFDEASNTIPLLAHLASSGPYSLKDFDLAGGFQALMHELMPKLDGSCMTVTGKTLAENYQNAKVYDREVIHTLDDPVFHDGGLAVLYGSLAPEGCIVKSAGVPRNLLEFSGKARVFNSLQDALDALHAGKIHPGDACILRFLGLRGRFGTTAYAFQEELHGYPELYNSCAIITDGRYSGASSGLSIGYVSPEAALGGPLALIEEGDEIHISIPKRSIEMMVDPDVLLKRRENFSWEFPANKYHKFLELFVRNVGSMSIGGAWK